MDAERFARLIARIDQLNSQDPNTELVNGVASPRELAYSTWLTEWALRLTPGASEALRIAARGQHVARWTIPRERYERTRRGYLRWREILKTFHIQRVGELMRQERYPEPLIERVSQIMSKRHLATDPDTQTLEDALCLVFLEHQLASFQLHTPDDKMSTIIRKTWQKMSARARDEALRLPLGDAERAVIAKALAAEPPVGAPHQAAPGEPDYTV